MFHLIILENLTTLLKKWRFLNYEIDVSHLTLSLPVTRRAGHNEFSQKIDDKLDFLLLFLFTRNNYNQEIMTTSLSSVNFDGELCM